MNLITIKDIEKINVSEYENEFDLEEKLNKLIYNDKAKEFLKNQYKLIKTQERRGKAGIRSDINKYRNMIFTGEIGTGKKTILNILSEMYYSMGIVKAKSIVQIDINELISMLNLGMKLEDVFNKSLEKTVLIDKADLLVKQENCSQIVSSLIKFLDQNKNKIFIVLSGERDGIRKLIASNPSLNYRFPLHFDFEDYSEKELFNIAINILTDKKFTLTNDANDLLNNTIIEFYNNKNLSLRNGLMIKSYLDKLIRAQSVRVYDEKVAQKEMNIIKVEDIYLSKEELLKSNDFILDNNQ